MVLLYGARKKLRSMDASRDEGPEAESIDSHSAQQQLVDQNRVTHSKASSLRNRASVRLHPQKHWIDLRVLQLGDA